VRRGNEVSVSEARVDGLTGDHRCDGAIDRVLHVRREHARHAVHSTRRLPGLLQLTHYQRASHRASSRPASHTHRPADLITAPTQHTPRQYKHRKQAATVPVARRRIAAARNPPTRARSGGKKVPV